jgi:hypothetical protein
MTDDLQLYKQHSRIDKIVDHLIEESKSDRRSAEDKQITWQHLITIATALTGD